MANASKPVITRLEIPTADFDRAGSCYVPESGRQRASGKGGSKGPLP